MINVEDDSIEKIARDVHAAGDNVNVHEIEARLESLLSYAKFKMIEANDDVEHVQMASDDIEGYNESTEFLVNEAKDMIENVQEEFQEILPPTNS